MRKRIMIMLMAVGMLSACTDNETHRELYQPDDTGDPVQTDDNDGQNKPEISPTEPDVPDTVSENVSIEPESRYKEVFYDECNGERKLEWLDRSQYPHKIESFIDSVRVRGESHKFDYRDLKDQELRLIFAIDMGAAYYQFPDILPEKNCFESSDISDPRGAFDEFGFYFSSDRQKVDSYFCRVFNCVPEDLEDINAKWDRDGSFIYEDINRVDQLYDPESHSFKEVTYRCVPYSYNGDYYFYDVDSWGDWAAAQSRPSYLGSIMDIEGVAYDGVYYYVRYAEYDKADYEANGASIDGIEAVEHEAVLQLKEENGDEYWSVFYIDAGHVPE